MVANFHKLCADSIRASGRRLPEIEEEGEAAKADALDRLYPELLVQASSELDQRFDAIIVDEGQDFLDSWWTSLLLLLNTAGYFHVYYDTRQRLWGTPGGLSTDVTEGAVSLELTENVRNTKPIHDLAMMFHMSRGKGYKALSTHGTAPEFVPVPIGQSEHVVVQRVVERLIDKEGVSPSDIAVLTPLSLRQGHSRWQPDKTLVGRFRLTHSLNPEAHEIFCSSIRSAKGLEFPVVILTELFADGALEMAASYAAQLYIGVSRARSHLVVIGEQERFSGLAEREGL